MSDYDGVDRIHELEAELAAERERADAAEANARLAIEAHDALRAELAEAKREWSSAVEREAGNFEEAKALRAELAEAKRILGAHELSLRNIQHDVALAQGGVRMQMELLREDIARLDARETKKEEP